MNLNTCQAAQVLRSLGWKFIDCDSYTLRTGWWTLPGASDVREMRRGDPKLYLESAVETIRLYVDEKGLLL